MRYRTIRTSDVGVPSFDAFGKIWLVEEFLGRVTPQDVGKRVYLRGNILQVESKEQFKARLA